MGTYVFKLPDIGEGVVEGEITAWHVAVGDTVSEDQPMVDIMTDKATVGIAATNDGEVTKLHGDVSCTNNSATLQGRLKYLNCAQFKPNHRFFL